MNRNRVTIKTMMYPEIHLPSQEISDEFFQANHSDQNKEPLKNSSNEIATSSSNPEKEDSPQDSNIHQLIEECSTEICEERKQSIEDTMLELVKICQEKEFLCIHDNVDDLIESALNTKLLSINSQRLEKEQEVKNVEEQPAERGNRKEPEHSLSMGYEHLSITPETESDEVTESNAENLFPIPSECEVTSEDEIYDDDFEDIEYVEASLSNSEIVSVEEENVVQHDVEEEEVDLEDISQIQDVVLHNFSREFETFCDHSKETRSGNTTHADNSLPEYDSFCFEIEPGQERLIYLVKNDIPDDSSNDLLLEEADLFLAFDSSIPPGIENFANDSEGDIRFLEELLIDDSILSHESSDSNFEDNPSIP
nr:hypothetical protein [Tanacetum cinerariifolium]